MHADGGGDRAAVDRLSQVQIKPAAYRLPQSPTRRDRITSSLQMVLRLVQCRLEQASAGGGMRGILAKGQRRLQYQAQGWRNTGQDDAYRLARLALLPPMADAQMVAIHKQDDEGHVAGQRLGPGPGIDQYGITDGQVDNDWVCPAR